MDHSFHFPSLDDDEDDGNVGDGSSERDSQRMRMYTLNLQKTAKAAEKELILRDFLQFLTISP